MLWFYIVFSSHDWRRLQGPQKESWENSVLAPWIVHPGFIVIESILFLSFFFFKKLEFVLLPRKCQCTPLLSSSSHSPLLSILSSKKWAAKITPSLKGQLANHFLKRDSEWAWLQEPRSIFPFSKTSKTKRNETKDIITKKPNKANRYFTCILLQHRDLLYLSCISDIFALKSFPARLKSLVTWAKHANNGMPVQFPFSST